MSKDIKERAEKILLIELNRIEAKSKVFETLNKLQNEINKTLSELIKKKEATPDFLRHDNTEISDRLNEWHKGLEDIKSTLTDLDVLIEKSGMSQDLKFLEVALKSS